MPKPLPSVLFAASECAPFAKMGGLGDVVGALPRALRAAGHDVRVVLPRYGTISTDGLTRHGAPLAVPLGGGEAWCAVWEGRLPGTDVPVYFLEHEALFGRPYLYDPPGGFASDNLARFALLSRGAVQLTKHLGWTPDVFHVHDWPTALVPLYLNTVESGGALGRAATVLTLHNVAHQSKFDPRDYPVTGLPWELLRPDGLEDHGQVNLLKGGLYHATKITAVSPRFAEEIRTPLGGAGLDGLLRYRGQDVVGILNGIDESIWDPANDPQIAAPFSPADLSGKLECKLALQREMHVAERPNTPLIGVVQRLTDQKGTDLLAEALDRILALDTQVVLLGAGDAAAESFFRIRSLFGGDRFRAYIGFSDALSHRIEAGADLFLMPSRFEPCGLNQLYSQRYGTLPVVRATGGLDDTVEACDPDTGEGTGFKFGPISADALVREVSWAVQVFRERPALFRRMQVRAMSKKMGWDVAAKRYAEVYEWAISQRRWLER